MLTIKISVIIPVYNSSQYLKDCLNSVLNQTLSDLEIIAIDDNSSDNSLEILNDFAQKYPQMHVYHNEKNLGQGKTRNRGLALATGEYIGFVDSDDLIHPKMYETMYQGALKHNRPEIVTTGINFTQNDYKLPSDINNSIRRPGRLHTVNNYPDILYWQSPSCGNKLFRHDFIKGQAFLENCMWEDIAFSFSAIIKANHVLEFSNNDYFYRRDITRGVSARGYQINPHITDIFRVADELEKTAQEHSRSQLFKSQIKLIQGAICLQRVNEITYWPIDEIAKQKLINQMYYLITEKYGDPKQVDQAILSSKVDLDKINKYLYHSPETHEESAKASHLHH